MALAVGLVLIVLADRNLYSTRLIFPFFKNLVPDLGALYVPFAALVLLAGLTTRARRRARAKSCWGWSPSCG